MVGSVHAVFDIAPLLAERRSVLWTLLATNAALTLALALLAWLTVRRMMRPVGILAAHLRAGAAGAVEPISTPEMATRPGGVPAACSAPSTTWPRRSRDREALSRQLAEEERLASLGRLASGMAHEINNPLGGLFNAIDTLKRHGERAEVRTPDHRPDRAGAEGHPRRRPDGACHLPGRRGRDATSPRADLDDLKLLISPEARRKELTLDWIERDERRTPGAGFRRPASRP